MSIQEMIAEAQKLSDAERQQLIEALTAMSGEDAADAPIKYRLSDLRGLGVELWQGIDAQIYINELRDE